MSLRISVCSPPSGVHLHTWGGGGGGGGVEGQEDGKQGHTLRCTTSFEISGACFFFDICPWTAKELALASALSIGMTGCY